MKVSKKGIYALRVLRHMTERRGEGPLSVAWLAEREKLSVKYLEQVLAVLRKGSLVVSTRGKQGGYELRLPPEDITVGRVLRLVDGPLAPIACASRTAPHPCEDCPDPFESCWVRGLMLEVRDSISDIVDRRTLADLVDS